MERKKYSPAEARNLSVAALSFIGDGVYETAIRRLLVDEGITSGDKLHRIAVKYVRAESQALAVKELMSDGLNDDELAVVKRARNHKFPNRSRSADAVEYRLATGFEALMGYLYLSGDEERLEEVISDAVEIIRSKVIGGINE